MTGQRSADNRKSESDFPVNKFLKHGLFLPPDPDAKHICIESSLSKGLAQAPGSNFSRYIVIY